jgi:hypothetical protein
VSKHLRKKAYPRAAQAFDVIPGQQSLLDDVPDGPDPEIEELRSSEVRSSLRKLLDELNRRKYSVETSLMMLDRGVSLPDVAEAMGLPPPVDRVTRRLKPWRLRRGSNMDVIATMLEDAGTVGVTETQMMAHLRDMGRLTNADKPLGSVHWTVAELAKRTRFAMRDSREKGGRWYAYGRFDTWRGPAA